MLKLYYQLTKYNEEGKIIKKTRKKRGKSFVKAFVTGLGADMANTSYQIYNIWELNYACNYGTFMCQSAGLNSTQTYRWDRQHYPEHTGIVLGTGTTAITSLDFDLDTTISHGTTSGKLEFYGCWIYNFVTGVSDCSFDIERICYNGSGGDITINEMGLYSAKQASVTTPGSDGTFCMVRDLIVPGVTVSNGEYLKVKYTLTIEV